VERRFFRKKKQSGAVFIFYQYQSEAKVNFKKNKIANSLAIFILFLPVKRQNKYSERIAISIMPK